MAQPKARQCIDLSEENGKDDASSVSSPPSPAGAMSGRVLGDEKQVPHQGEVKQKVPLQRLNQYMARSGGSRDSYTTSTYFPHDKDTLDESDEADELHGNSFVTTPNMVRGKQKNYSGKGEPAEPAPPAFELYQDPTQHMPSSDIRRSSFEKSGPRMQEDAKKPSNRHKPIEWSLALFRGNDGDDLCYCVMQLDPQHNRFVAGAEGFVISEAPPSRSIEAKRVNRLQYCCADPGYVDLQGPMEHGGSQYRRQLIFNSAAQTEAFLRMLDKQTTIETKQHQKKPV